MRSIPLINNELTKRTYDGGFGDVYGSTFSWNERWENDHAFYEKIVKQYKVKSVLDVGCGNGFHLCLLSEIDGIHRIVGVDYSKKMVKIAREILKDRNIHNVNVVRANCLDLASHFQEKFDLIVCEFVLSAIPSEKQIIESLVQLKKLLSKNGLLLIEDRNGDRIANNPPNVEMRSIDEISYDIVKRKNISIKIFDTWKIPRIFYSKHKWIVEIGLPSLYQYMKQKNVYLKVYHNVDPYIVHDHIFIRQGLFRRLDIEQYKTRCWLLPKKKLMKYLDKAGFGKYTFYSNHTFDPYRQNSQNQVVLVQ